MNWLLLSLLTGVLAASYWAQASEVNCGPLYAQLQKKHAEITAEVARLRAEAGPQFTDYVTQLRLREEARLQQEIDRCNQAIDAVKAKVGNLIEEKASLAQRRQ